MPPNASKPIEAEVVRRGARKRTTRKKESLKMALNQFNPKAVEKFKELNFETPDNARLPSTIFSPEVLSTEVLATETDNLKTTKNK